MHIDWADSFAEHPRRSWKFNILYTDLLNMRSETYLAHTQHHKRNIFHVLCIKRWVTKWRIGHSTWYLNSIIWGKKATYLRHLCKNYSSKHGNRKKRYINIDIFFSGIKTLKRSVCTVAGDFHRNIGKDWYKPTAIISEKSKQGS